MKLTFILTFAAALSPLPQPRAQEIVIPQAAGLQVIGFSESVQFSIVGQLVSLTAGSPGFAIPPGTQTRILRGDAMMVTGETLIRAEAGADFTFLITDGISQVLIHDGSLLVTPPGGREIRLRPGPLTPLTGPQAGMQPRPGGAEPRRAGLHGGYGDARPGGAEPRPAETAVGARPEAVPAREAWDPLSAVAQGAQRLSRFERPKLKLVMEVHPYYRFRETYESNIFLVPPDKADGSRTGGGVRGSWVTTNVLGSKFALPLNRRRRIDVDYNSKLINYSYLPGANNAFDQFVDARYTQQGRRGVSLKAFETYLNTEDPAFSEIVVRERRFKNDSGFDLEFARSRRFNLRFKGMHTIHKYLSPSLAASLNRFELRGDVEAGFMVQPKTRLYLGYGRDVTHYSAGSGNHSKSHRLGLGVDGRITSKIEGEIRGDLHLRRYANPGTGTRGQNANNGIVALNLKYAPKQKTEVLTRVFRSINETTFQATLNRYYVSTGGSLGLRHSWHKYDFSVDGGFSTDRYPETVTIGAVTANRRDDLYSGGVRIVYKIRPWLTTGLGYQRLQRHSVFAESFNYKNDKTSFDLLITF